MTVGTAKHAPPYPVPREPVLRGLWQFLKDPTPTVRYDAKPWRTFLILLAVFASLALVFGFAIVFPIESAIDAPGNVIEDEESTAILIGLAFAAVFVAPPLEEISFRLALAEYQPALPLIGGVVAVLFLIAIFEFPTGLILSLGLLVGLYMAFLLVAGGAGLSMRLLPKMPDIWRRHFRWVVYGSSVVFGLIHITNWAWESYGVVEIAAMPLMTLPQLVGGFVLAYARVRLGIIYAILLHGAYNAAVVPLIFIT